MWFISNPRRALLTAFLLMLVGVILPFMMVAHIIESTFFLNFLSYICSLTGMLIGIIGVARGGLFSGKKDKRK
ncbi:MAG: hypothetical protein ACK2TS_07015 [Anaerolineales bacterium]|jgi:hypothetical protein